MLVITMCVALASADCKAVETAVSLQSKTPFHATIARAAAKPDEAIWINNTLYTKMSGNWLPSPMAPDHVLSGVTGGVTNFSECRRVGDDVVRGEATAVYAAKMESGEHVQLWVSSKTGLLLRDAVDVQGIKVTADFDYANVRAPAT